MNLWLYLAIKFVLAFGIGYTIGTVYTALVEFNWWSYGILMLVTLWFFFFQYGDLFDAAMEKIGLGPEIS